VSTQRLMGRVPLSWRAASMARSAIAGSPPAAPAGSPDAGPANGGPTPGRTDAGPGPGGSGSADARPGGTRAGDAVPAARRVLQWPRLSWVDVAWVGFVGLNLAAMRLLPAWQTVPFLAIWVSLTVIYGFRLWRLQPTILTLAAVTLATGGIIAVQVLKGKQGPPPAGGDRGPAGGDGGGAAGVAGEPAAAQAAAAVPAGRLP
jgi:hypothetical protein